MKLKQTGKLAPANKPWQLIRDAIADLTLQERCKSVKIDMVRWHQANGVCRQCLAGVVMSRRLGVDTTTQSRPTNFAPDICARLNALNAFREGDIGGAFYFLDLHMPPNVYSPGPIARYARFPERFKRQMLALADTLEAAAHRDEKRRKRVAE